MPFYSKRGSKTSKKRIYKKKGKVSKAVKAYVKRELAMTPEHKYFEIINASNFGYQGLTVQLAAVAQGTANNLRIGNKIKPVKIDLGLEFLGAPATGAVYNFVRCIVFVWHPDDTSTFGVAPLPKDILQTIGSNQTPSSPYQFDAKDQFTVLYDRRFSLCGLSEFQYESIRLTHKNIKCKHTITFNNTGTVTGSNKIWMVLFSDEDALGPANLLPTCNWYSRLVFTDA